MAVRMIVLKDFEQKHDGIIKKFITGQEIVGPLAQFMYFKKGNEYLKATEGIYYEGNIPSKEEIKKEVLKEVEIEKVSKKTKKRKK